MPPRAQQRGPRAPAGTFPEDPSIARPCPACGERALAPWRTVPASDPALPGDYALLRCSGCGSAVTLA
ncbi:MAG TPA: hypothetical protein VGR11_06990, partial [Solirubrobacteraceae bacterium]|nr:hypothetical protein [Solirubrobacteraceae bacterium]